LRSPMVVFFDHTIEEYRRATSHRYLVSPSSPPSFSITSITRSRSHAQHFGWLPHELLLLHRSRCLQPPGCLASCQPPDGPHRSHQRRDLRPPRHWLALSRRFPCHSQCPYGVVICFIALSKADPGATPALCGLHPQLAELRPWFWTVGPCRRADTSIVPSTPWITSDRHTEDQFVMPYLGFVSS